jgi:hypothetical protein
MMSCISDNYVPLTDVLYKIGGLLDTPPLACALNQQILYPPPVSAGSQMYINII